MNIYSVRINIGSKNIFVIVKSKTEDSVLSQVEEWLDQEFYKRRDKWFNYNIINNEWPTIQQWTVKRITDPIWEMSLLILMGQDNLIKIGEWCK